MKIRNSFVSNSSSSSFIIKKDDLLLFQIEAIIDHIEASKALNTGETCLDPMDAWIIKERENDILGYTIMDNFDMELFLEKIGVDDRSINWSVDFSWYDYED